MRFNYEKLPHMDSNSSSLTNLYMSTKLKKLSCYRKLILSLEKSTVICPIPKRSANGFNFVFFFFLEESSLYWTRTRWCILLILAGRWIALSSRPTWSTSKHQDSQSCTETVFILQKWTVSLWHELSYYLLCASGWHWTPSNPHASAFQVLGVQTTPTLNSFFNSKNSEFGKIIQWVKWLILKHEGSQSQGTLVSVSGCLKR